MNENINLRELLRGHLEETFYSPLLGNVKLKDLDNYGFPIVIESENEQYSVALTSRGYFKENKEAECMLFPSKDQRDWNKWVEEQKSKIPKTWSELCDNSQNKCYALYEIDSVRVVASNHNINPTPIEKSALALLKIHQLIEVGYGGNITNEEWNNFNLAKHCIHVDMDADKPISKVVFYAVKHHIAFRTEEQAKEFLSYPENVQLIKDFYSL